LQITVPISATYYPIVSYYPYLLRVYIEALELYSQSSRSFNSSPLQSLQLWARIALPAKQSIYYLIQEVTTSITFAVSRASSPIKRTDDRPQSTNVPDRRTNWRIKSKVRNVKIRFSPRRQLDPAWPVKILKMTTTSESKINVILNQPSDWIQWFFIVQDTAETNKVWQYIDPSIKKDKLLKLESPSRPIPRDVLPTATLIAKLDAS